MTAARRDTLLAVAFAVLFTLAWTVRDWANLSQLRLPDTDDAVRLQQIRDWLAGQAFGDLTQYRLGNGVPMHWSRLADLVPGGLIVGLSPLVGRHAAELAAVIVWPGVLFALALALTARIARVMLVSAPTAIVIAALAFPASAMFVPGRIDHHGLQLVLLLGLVAAMLHPRGMASGVAIGLASTLSLVVGVETAPFLALAAVLAVLGWVASRPGSTAQLRGLGVALAAGLLAARMIFAPMAFAFPACDGFTQQVWLASLIGAAGVMALAVLGRMSSARPVRLGLAAVVAVAMGGAILWVAPACLSPYGGVDPAVAARWLAKVAEAQPLFAAPLFIAIGQVGVMLAGIVAAALALRRTRDPGWAILLLFQGTALAISVWQIRGASAGALLAAPALAWLVGVARTKGVLALAGAWLVSAGIVYPLVGNNLIPVPSPFSVRSRPLASCDTPAQVAALASLPRGRIAGPIDLGGWGTAATSHGFLAAPYHRNNAGNAAAFAIFDGPRARALAIARSWRVDYVATCNAVPGWLARERPFLESGALSVYRIADLPPTTPSP